MILKVCGITNQADADAAVEGGATAIGFNFYPRSPRYIAPERAAEISTPAGVRRVGVFVNESRPRVEEVARTAWLAVAQLHGDETQADYPQGSLVWKGVRVTEDFDFSRRYDCEALLLDGPAAGLYGGAGKTFDWSLAGRASWPDMRIVLAGGLDATNVAQAIALAHPWGVDACSGIEIAPGRKDRRKMQAFLEAAKAALGA